MTKVNSRNTLRKPRNLLIYCNIYQYFLIFVIVASVAWSSLAWSKPPHIEVVALFENKAMLMIDNERVLISVGDTTVHGITLLAADAKGALLQVDGRQQRFELGGLVRSTPSNKAQDDPKIYVYRGIDNLFRTTGSVNGYPVNFLVDTGASSIAMSSQDAKRLGINYRLDGNPTWISTASGTEAGYNVTIDRVTISGVTLRSVAGLVIEGSEPTTPLLGMSYLNRFEITNSGHVMTLKRKY